jgi:RNA polymerase sigma-70 factor (ECF subfamily)
MKDSAPTFLPVRMYINCARSQSGNQIMDDLQAIRRLKSGDISGLELLIAHYQAKAIRTAFLVTHNEHMAEDVVQDVFIRFFQRASSFDEQRSFEPYFLRSIVNAALNAVQKEKREAYLPEGDISVLESLLERAASVEDQVESLHFERQILDSLSKLPPRQRAVIVQRYYLEMSEKEMGESLEAPAGTVKWLLSAARERLRALLGSEWMAE